jgi:ABC-2 type transport system ATP-binding protein
MIRVNNLVKNYETTIAVDDVTFDVKEGEIFGLLGPNGAGKSTIIKILVTILKANKGSAFINGFDVVKDQNKVRRSIGIIFQDPSLDIRLTGWENLYFHSRLYHVPPKDIKSRISTSLDLVGLSDRQRDLVATYSGGMKRRLEIARGIIHTPKVLFLDEPTIGLDPQTRKYIWKYLSDLRKKEKLTMLLTTHYMEEAEICDRIAIIDNGKIIALDTPSNLKKSVRSDHIILSSGDPEGLSEIIKNKFNITPQNNGKDIRIAVPDAVTFLPGLFKTAGSMITGADMSKPSLEDVFIKLTGRTIRDEDAGARDRMKFKARRRKKS